MHPSTQVLNPSEAAQRLGVSTKARRLYEERGLLQPVKTEAGWRAYGPSEMARAAQISALRGLGFSLAQVKRVLGGNHDRLEVGLAERQAVLEGRIRNVADAVGRVRKLRGDLSRPARGAGAHGGGGGVVAESGLKDLPGKA